MDDHKLKVFCTVAETKSFSKTSEIIHLTQPAVSLQIQALEEIYETRLFDRSSNTVTLTPAGEILYNYAKDILSLYASAEKELGTLTRVVKGGITIGASSTIGNYVLPRVIVDFRKKYPKIRAHLLVGNTRRIVEFLNEGTIDLGLVEGEVSRQKITVEKLLSDELVLIMSPKNALAKRANIRISDIVKEPFILREEGSGTRQVLEKYLAKHGIYPQNMKISLVLGSTESIKQAVEDGAGVSIVSRWAARKESRYGSLKIATFMEDRFLRDFTLIYTKNIFSSHIFVEFMNFLKNYHFEKFLEG